VRSCGDAELAPAPPGPNLLRCGCLLALLTLPLVSTFPQMMYFKKVCCVPRF
jgi:hypothetical protein